MKIIHEELYLFVVVFDFKLHSLNADISRSQIRLLKADSRAQGGDSKPENEKCCRFSQSEQSKSVSKSRLHEQESFNLKRSFPKVAEVY